jgi:hypothetical protein
MKTIAAPHQFGENQGLSGLVTDIVDLMFLTQSCLRNLPDSIRVNTLSLGIFFTFFDFFFVVDFGKNREKLARNSQYWKDKTNER